MNIYAQKILYWLWPELQQTARIIPRLWTALERASQRNAALVADIKTAQAEQRKAMELNAELTEFLMTAEAEIENLAEALRLRRAGCVKLDQMNLYMSEAAADFINTHIAALQHSADNSVTAQQSIIHDALAEIAVLRKHLRATRRTIQRLRSK